MLANPAANFIFAIRAREARMLSQGDSLMKINAQIYSIFWAPQPPTARLTRGFCFYGFSVLTSISVFRLPSSKEGKIR
jgi:hypothetical protein